MSVRLLVFRVALAMLLQTGISRGDAIDGDWCSTDGMRMSIRAEKITIPSGKQIDGNCSRPCSPTSGPSTRLAATAARNFC